MNQSLTLYTSIILSVSITEHMRLQLECMFSLVEQILITVVLAVTHY